MAKRRLLRWLAGSILLIAAAGATYWYASGWHAGGQTRKGQSAGAPQTEGPVPVHVASAGRADFPVYLNSIGQVSPWQSVTVRTRVDGTIDKLAYDEGQMVKAGDLLIQIDPRPFQATLDQATAKQALDAAQLANTQRDLTRLEKVGTLAASQQQIDTQRALVTQQQAQVRSDQAAVESAQVQLGYTTIKAPISGRIGFRLVDQGNIVHASDSTGVATIVGLEPIAVIFTEPQEQLPAITEALQSGPLQVIALTSDASRELDRGELTLVDNTVDPATGSIRLKARFANEKQALWPGLTVATRLLIATHRNVVVIPEDGVQHGPANKLFAYVIGSDNKAAMRDIGVGEIQRGKAEITAGLDAGDRVVVSGAYRLAPGVAVQVAGTSDSEEKTAAHPGSQKAASEVE